VLGVLADYIGRFSTKSTIPVIVFDEVFFSTRLGQVLLANLGLGLRKKKQRERAECKLCIWAD